MINDACIRGEGKIGKVFPRTTKLVRLFLFEVVGDRRIGENADSPIRRAVIYGTPDRSDRSEILSTEICNRTVSQEIRFLV